MTTSNEKKQRNYLGGWFVRPLPVMQRGGNEIAWCRSPTLRTVATYTAIYKETRRKVTPYTIRFEHLFEGQKVQSADLNSFSSRCSLMIIYYEYIFMPHRSYSIMKCLPCIVDRYSAGQDISCVYGNRGFVTQFTNAHH
jgi:hypothetical protein